jgi:sporulation protein YlmC with PRC-barrel domain
MVNSFVRLYACKRVNPHTGAGNCFFYEAAFPEELLKGVFRNEDTNKFRSRRKMMNKLGVLALLFVLFAFVAAPVFAAQSEVGKLPADKPAMRKAEMERGAADPAHKKDPMMKSEAGAEMKHEAFERASKFIGMSIVNENNEKLGKVDDVILEKDGRVSFVILAHGGLLGIGDKLVPIPWNMVASAMGMAKDRDHIVLNLTKEQLEKAPNFDSRNFPNFADASFRNQVRDYFATGASAEKKAGFTETR